MSRFLTTLQTERIRKKASSLMFHLSENNHEEAMSYAVEYCSGVFDFGGISFSTVPNSIFKEWFEYTLLRIENENNNDMSSRKIIREKALKLFHSCEQCFWESKKQ